MRELELLKHIYGFNADLPSHVTIPPGDDMGALRLGDRTVLVTVDQIADGVHFTRRDTPLEKIGRKAITRNLSDVAAMAGKPIGAVAGVCLPRDMTAAQADALFDAMRRTAQAYDCPLFGGDITIWDHPLALSVTLLAEPAGAAPVLRRGAKVGDIICVTGELGGSLQAVQQSDGTARVHHLDFEPRLRIAQALVRDHDVTLHSMIDLSDGLATDLAHICRASNVSAEIWSDRLPISQASHLAAHRDGREPWEHALGDGEDYELCFTLDAVQADRALPTQIEGVPIARIGVITPDDDSSSLTIRHPDGSLRELNRAGWEHHG